VIGQQPDLHRPLVEIRGREAFHAVADDRARDRERVDLVRLARLALPLPRRAHPVRCHANDAHTGGDQRVLKAPGDMPAVLDRPHPLVIQPRAHFTAARCPASSASISRLPRTRPVPSSTAASACLYLCVSVPITIIQTVASFRYGRRSGSPADSSHSGRLPRSYQVTPEGPRAAAGDTTFASQTSRSTSSLRVSPPSAREPTATVGRHRPDERRL
jgi:hypothetical protein